VTPRPLVRASACVAIVLTFAFSRATPLTTTALQVQPTVVELQRAVDTILSAPELEAASWGVLVESPKTGETLYSLNAAKLLMPASTLKVVTLAAAAERLGWDYSYETRIVADGRVAGDTIAGNLVIIASGDPSLSRGALESWAAQVRALGIRKVRARCWPTHAGSAAKTWARAGRGTIGRTTPHPWPRHGSVRTPSTSPYGPGDRRVRRRCTN
jgi:D-alanyl-D-alanine carboxypeptidase/D-alanyl-D-alanine-endopeptidase (penicillin-binding protein 4)